MAENQPNEEGTEQDAASNAESHQDEKPGTDDNQEGTSGTTRGSTPKKPPIDPDVAIGLHYKKGSGVRIPNVPTHDLTVNEVKAYFDTQRKLDSAVAGGGYSTTDHTPTLPKTTTIEG